MTNPITTAAEMQEAAAKLVEPKVPRPCDCESCYCHNSDDAAAVLAWDQSVGDAARIRALPIAEPQAGADAAKPAWPDRAKYGYGYLVNKPRGSNWSGHICGWYSTQLTPIGYAVLSDRHENAVQIYPEASLVAEPRTESDAQRESYVRVVAEKRLETKKAPPAP
jgi:hypothetical protein